MDSNTKNNTVNTSKPANPEPKERFSNCDHCNQNGSIEPLPESSRPRRDGPGGD